MIKKKITIKPILELRNAEKKIDDWINYSSKEEIEERDPIQEKSTALQTDYRFTVVIPEFLHRRIKKYCAVNGISIKEKLTEIFEKEFPES